MSIAVGSNMRMSLDDYRGLSAYEIARQNGFEGTEAEWLESLHGRDGATTSVNGVEQVDGAITLTAASIPVSLENARTLADVIAQLDALLSLLSVTEDSLDLGGKYIDNALFR